MGWPYGFPDLSSDEKLLRRQTLDLYACIAHYSALAPLLLFLFYRLGRRLAAAAAPYFSSAPPDFASRGTYDQVPPHSPLAKARRRGDSGSLSARWRRLSWWLRGDVLLCGSHCGQRDEWLLGISYMAWLLVLSIKDTGTDYFHLTKRFGAVAVSQLPIHYLLALKALNPFSWAFGSSHEQVNRYHRVLGRVVYALLVVHIVLYNAFFFSAGIWLRRFFAPIVFCGVVASLGLHAVIATSMATIRQLSYRLFFITHLAVAFFVPLLIVFHAPSLRLYAIETLVIFFLGIGLRRVTTIKSLSSLETIPGTNLVKISSSIPRHKLHSFKAVPGLHVYLSIPPESRASLDQASKSAVFDCLCNPFTVASVNDQDATITLIARTRRGPVTALLSRLADLPTGSESAPATHRIPLGIEGPYGSMANHFEELIRWGPARTLIIAGGVGATFALPVYQCLGRDLPTSSRMKLVWAIRGAGDATWAVSLGTSLLDDEHVQLYLTGDMEVSDNSNNAAGGAVEMMALQRTVDGTPAANSHRKRPDLETIVNDTFRQGHEESVAVLVCGPAGMATEVRCCLEPWIKSGRRVWWHSESFGW